MKKFFVGLLALLAITLGVSPAHAALPGQPNGIPESAWSNGMRFATGNICFEDWTNGFAADAIQNAATKYTASSDLNTFRSLDCEAAGYNDENTITFVNNYTDCFESGAKGQALIWSEGGYYVPNYVIVRAIVHIFPNCSNTWGPGSGATAQEELMRKRLVINHEIGHVWGFKHVEFPNCLVGVYQDWKCRTDTVMAGEAVTYPNGAVGYNPTEWDFYRIDQIHPW